MNAAPLNPNAYEASDDLVLDDRFDPLPCEGADRDVTVKKLHECNHIHPLDCGARQAAIRGLLGKAETTVLWSSPSFAPTDITPRWAITSSSMSTTSSWTAEK